MEVDLAKQQLFLVRMIVSREQGGNVWSLEEVVGGPYPQEGDSAATEEEESHGLMI